MEWDEFGKIVVELGEKRKKISFFAIKGLLDNLDTAELVGICEQGGFSVYSWIKKGILEQVGFPDLGKDINLAAFQSLRLLFSLAGRQAHHIEWDNKNFPRQLNINCFNYQKDWNLGVIFNTWQPLSLYKDNGIKLLDSKIDQSLSGRWQTVLHENLKAKIVLYPKDGYMGKGLCWSEQNGEFLNNLRTQFGAVKLASLSETVFLTAVNYLETRKFPKDNVWIKTTSNTDDDKQLIFGLHQTWVDINDTIHDYNGNMAVFPLVILWAE